MCIRDRLPTNWTTRRVAVRDAADDDTPALTAIFNACTYAQPWDPTFHPVERLAARFGHLPL